MMRRYLEREVIDNFPMNYEEDHGWLVEEPNVAGRFSIKLLNISILN